MRAVTFVVVIYALLLGMGLVGLPSAALSRRAALGWVKRYCRWACWLAGVMCRIRCEVRGPVPDFPCIVAAKHQSFLDVMMLVVALPAPRFVMKRSLLWAPVLGYFARRMGCIAIDRSAGGEAAKVMVAGVGAWAGDRGQIVIFPQGTRVAPGAVVPFRGGVLKLSTAFGLPVVTAAVNTGWFWPRTGTRRTPGTAVVEFLETIPVGAPPGTLLRRIEGGIEEGSERLAAEAAKEIAGTGQGARR